VKVVRIRHAAAAAVKLSKTIFALFFRIDIAVSEIIRNLRPYNSFVHIAHKELLLAYELVAGIDIPPGRHRQVLRSRAAPGQSLRHARPTL
jgi:hypothetical protein